MGGSIENEILQLLDCPVYKNLRETGDSLFPGILETEEIDQSYGNRFKKLRSAFTQGSLKSLKLLTVYIL